MDNISGSANWTVCDTPVKKETVIIEDKPKIPYISPDLKHLDALIIELEEKYKLTPKKEVNEALILLKTSKQLL